MRISLSHTITAEVVRMMADPAGRQPENYKAAVAIDFIDPDTEQGAAELGAIEIAKLARLLPATVVATLPKKEWLTYPPGLTPSLF